MKFYILSTLALCLGLASCNEADVASNNISTAADQFQVTRRIVFYNGITDTYMLTIEGLCSLGNESTPNKVSVTCKTGPTAYKKHYLGLSDNVTYFVEHVDSTNVSGSQYKVIFRPSIIVPDIEVK